MKALDCCAGAGGLSLGLHRAGEAGVVIARGLTVGVADRGDVLFRRRVPQAGQTLRGLL